MITQLIKQAIFIVICITLFGSVQASTQEDIKMDKVFDKLLTAHDKDYINAEQLLLNSGQAAVNALQKQTKNADPVACLLASVLLKRVLGQAPEQLKALEYLEFIPKRLEGTALGMPQPIDVAEELEDRFGAHALDYLALRVLKQREWPFWKAMGVLLYLKKYNKASTHHALIRFAVETNNEEWQKLAIEILGEETDKESLKAKVVYERKRIESMKKKFPDALKILE